jgi:peptidoglycan/xylan/chitin deacetylase (PgdA/CDA1 family)
MKRVALSLIAGTVAVPYWRGLVRDVAIIFMLHRFSDADRGVEGVQIESLRAQLAFLRRHGFRFGSFQDLLSEPPSVKSRSAPLVLFTVDDGYADFANVALPVFAEFDCPVTVFLTTGPVDRSSWFWWDKVEYSIKESRRSGIRLELGGEPATWSWASTDQRQRATLDIVDRLKRIPNELKLEALATLAERLEVSVPSQPPSQYEAMSWADVRRCEALGVSFGPHTVTHPILTQLSAAQAEWEITESWKRLRSECVNTVPVFCYPNGLFSPREVKILRRTDMIAAVTTKPYYTSRTVSRGQSSDARFSLPRFNYASDHLEFVTIATGLDRVNALFREGPVGWRALGGIETSRVP